MTKQRDQSKEVLELFYQFLDDEELLNDRREYVIEDYKLSYDLNEQHAKDLYDLVQGDIETSGHTLEDVDIKAYMLDACHNCWDGWEPYEIVVLEKLVHDMRRAQANGLI